ncbi:MAG: hypothetical protein AVDCRST_MAG17-2016 [uncultured Solirubrobacterales bacterium]|uniref:GYD domain-containing protein n=1 Tax=uncultured Solirubrobacterales bacterium TaxID=768556 RepID=A0A6J4T1W9_9ACTN|nr:MAG: hypothetical protein AVDCRST_MAG17-2016 [uncultured Solirubrobacterales bacterium]
MSRWWPLGAQALGRSGGRPATATRLGAERATMARSFPPCAKGPPVPTYIMLSRLTPDGVQTIKNNPQRIKEVNREIEQLGAEVKAQWATLGQFDFVNVIEAPDDVTMSRISLELGSRGTARYESMSAIPIDDFVSAL